MTTVDQSVRVTASTIVPPPCLKAGCRHSVLLLHTCCQHFEPKYFTFGFISPDSSCPSFFACFLCNSAHPNLPQSLEAVLVDNLLAMVRTGEPSWRSYYQQGSRYGLRLPVVAPTLNAKLVKTRRKENRFLFWGSSHRCPKQLIIVPSAAQLSRLLSHSFE